jgi:hypothetical protein
MGQDVRSLLRQCIKQKDKDFEAAGEELGCTGARLYQVVNGDDPSFDLAAAIECRYGIAMAEWKGVAA